MNRALVVFVFVASCATPMRKIVVRSVAELPIHQYRIPTSVSQLIQSQSDFSHFSHAVGRDLEENLKKYEVKDATTLQYWYLMLERIYAMGGNFSKAVELNDMGRALEDKEPVRLMYGHVLRAMKVANMATGALPGEVAFNKTFKANLTRFLRALPWEVVQDEIIDAKSRMELLSRTMLLGLARSGYDPAVAKSKQISSDLVPKVIAYGYTLHLILPLREEIKAVYTSLVDKNKKPKPNIWPTREVRIRADAKHAPVVVAVWDSGVDPKVFGDQMFRTTEVINGKDDNNNGFVDDIHGIGFDIYGNYIPQTLVQVGNRAEKLQESLGHLKGLMDLRSGIDSPQARELKRVLSEMQPEAIGDFFETLTFLIYYTHGTHVAGILIEGNPFARILVVRLSGEYGSIPTLMTEEIAHRHAAGFRKTAQYLRKYNVRVTNMSWSSTLKSIEKNLELNNFGSSVEERRITARKIHNIQLEGMRDAISSSPGILFVTSAGNTDDDVAFSEDMLGSISDLPNLILVGAVDQAGRRTRFTSMGKNVRFYANGFEVESFIPGGGRKKASGTSMAAPNVANLATKLITLRPQLKPAQVVSLIERGADAFEDQPELLLINPKRTIEILEQSQQNGQ